MNGHCKMSVDADECRSPEEVGSPADELDVLRVNEIWRELGKNFEKEQRGA